jgi:hypothetical protein
MLRRTSLFVLVLLALAIVPVASAQDDQRCFPETGQCISGRIRQFWEQNGGLPVFGFPTGPQQEIQIEGKPFQAQLFERNRLELHPENQPPYDVLLGRLGADRLAQQNRDPFTFPKSEQQQGCRFFPETGHNVCGAILNAWRASGLEFDGVSGKSEGENLALFGLPLSDVMTETIEGKEYQVQWFERARFELHPENQPPFNVLLGLLGNEVRDNGGGAAPPPAPPSQAINLQGKGKVVTDKFTLPAHYSRATVKHQGERNFAVWVYFADNSRDLLVNTIGDYDGTVLLRGAGETFFEIEADGPWTITVDALGPDDAAAQGVSGSGDYVSGTFMPARVGPVPYSFSHNGEDNFAVWLRCDGGDDLVANEIGKVSGEVVVDFEKGPCVWEVRADGDWNVRPK